MTLIVTSSFLDKQEMHGPIRDDNERRTKNRETNDVLPQREVVEAERGQYRGAGDLNVEAVAGFGESELVHLVHDQSLVRVVKDR